MKLYLSLIFSLLGVAVAQATVIPYAFYEMGDGIPATNGGNNLPFDSSGNGRHMADSASGTPAISAVGGPTNDAFYTFTGSNQHFFDTVTSASWNPPEDNVGIEVWVRTSNLTQSNKNVFGTGNNDVGINVGFDATDGRGWFGAVAGISFAGTTGMAGYAADTWIHLAAVRSAGTTTFYANGVARGTTNTAVRDASGNNVHRIAVNSNGSAFTGDIALARIFTFTAGAFNPNTDLLITQVPPQDVKEEIVSTTAGKTYLARFQLEPKSGQTSVPRLNLSITGDGSLGNHSLQTQLSGGAPAVPYFIRFTANSASTRLKFTEVVGSSATASQITGLTVAEPISATPSTVANAGQQAQIDRRYGLFLHYGINTFHNQEWTDGSLPASSYQPTSVDVDQWVQTAYEAGMRYVLIIAKHHEGFCVWDSPWTTYDVASTSMPTDVVAAAAAACKKYGIKLALYYSIWDRHEPTYQADDSYNQYMLRQMTELLSNYGPVCELWLDGGWDKSNDRWPSIEIYDLVRRLQPDCQVSTNWTIGLPGNPDAGSVHPSDQQTGYPVRYFPSDFRLGDPYFPKFTDPKVFSNDGSSYYLPFESTVTLSSRDQWFYKTYDTENKSINALAELYYAATAQDNILVLNAPPDRSGKIRPLERDTLFQLRNKLGLSAGAPLPKNVTGQATGTASSVWSNETANYGPQRALDGDPTTRWASGVSNCTFEIDLGAVRNFNRLLIDEYEQSAGIGRITSFRLQSWDGIGWTTFHSGTTCSRFSLHNFLAQSTSKIRLLIDTATAAPSILEAQVYQTEHAFTTWRDQRFAPHGNSNPDYAWDADPDLDGRMNLFEFALNDDVLDPTPSTKIAMRASTDPGLDSFVFTLPVRDGAIFTGSAPPTAAVDGVTYQVQGSADLQSFNAPLIEVIPAHSTGLPPLDIGWSYRSFRHATPTLEQGFFQIKASH
jgi:alpha-L-fucosidase